MGTNANRVIGIFHLTPADVPDMLGSPAAVEPLIGSGTVSKRELEIMSMLILRISDTLLAIFWIWALIQSLRAGRIGGSQGFQWHRDERPAFYWFLIFILALMVAHFGGLAIVGQKLDF